MVVAGALFWFMSGSDETTPPAVVQEEQTPAPAITESDVVFDEVPLGGSGTDVEALLDEARAARTAGQIFNPPGSNAIELFAAALAADPQNNIVAAELDATVSEALGMAESAMLENRLDDADAALTRVGEATPGHERLPFMTAQLSQMQLRSRLDDARLAIRESRFEDAATSIASARTLSVSDATEIDVVEAELGCSTQRATGRRSPSPALMRASNPAHF